MAKRTGPMKPSEVGARQRESFPPEVFEAFDELIAQNFADGRAKIETPEVSKLIIAKLNGSRRFSSKWLNVEEAYRAAGWKVKYDSPGYNENYEAHFIFSR
ncbi:MAG: hypothetical protein V4690_00575 [Patescibacteria group bacterium]